MTFDARHFLISHIAWVVIVAILVISGYEYIGQQKSLAQAEQKAHDAEAVIADLQKQISARDAAIGDLKTQMATRAAQTQKQIAALSKAVENVKTPEQVVQSLPVVTDIPLNAHTIPNSVQVAVDAQPLFAGLAVCRQQSLELNSCKADLTDEKKVADNLVASAADQRKIIDQKQQEIDGFKKAAKHHGFFGKIWAATQKVGLLGIGLAIGKAL